MILYRVGISLAATAFGCFAGISVWDSSSKLTILFPGSLSLVSLVLRLISYRPFLFGFASFGYLDLNLFLALLAASLQGRFYSRLYQRE